MTASSDLLHLIRLQVCVYHNAKVCGNWLIQEHEPGRTCFHVVTDGSCRLEVPGHLSTLLNTGDLLLFPRELPHSMVPLEAQEGPQRHLRYAEADKIPGTGLLCAAVSFRHKASNQLLQALPPLVLIRNNDDNPWLEPLLHMIIGESDGDKPMSEVILERLCELLFTYALTHFINNLPPQTNLLALHTHPRLANTLNAIHASPAAHWTLESMAKHAAQSRTLFARTFKQSSGWTPMQYLTWWRMQLAWSLLESGKAVAKVAEDVGYESLAAFSRAFRKCFALSAGEVRRQARETLK
ncbi:MAG: AraC family transcriptional regulator [Pseudomonadales bacterium]|nr:AraC family transcriptional regulator [Pseudomonadales bacterium]